MYVRRIRLAFLLLAAALAAPATAQSPAEALPAAPVDARRVDTASGDLVGGERIRAGQETAAITPAVACADAARRTVTNPGLLKAMSMSVQEKSALPTEAAFAAAQEKFPVPPEARAEFRRMYEEARDLYPAYHAKVQAAQDALGGQAIVVPLKEPQRAQEKLLVGIVGELAPRESVKDILRSTVVVIDQGEVQTAIDAVMAQFPGAMVKRNLLAPGSAGLGATGYRDVLINAPMGNLVVEVQINFPAMIDLKEGPGHALYERQREITDRVRRESREGNETPAELAEIARLDCEQFALYNPPWLAFNRRSASSASIGSPSDSATDRSAGRVDPSGKSLQADAPRTATITGAENPVSKNCQGASPDTSGSGSLESGRDCMLGTGF